MAPFKNNFSFSFSRHAQLKECARAYYYARYMYWNGWRDNEPYNVKMAWRLKRLSSPQMLAGSIVHDLIAEDISNIQRFGTPKDWETLRTEAARRLNKGYTESSELKFLVDKNATTFAGHFYPSLERYLKPQSEMLDLIKTCLRNYRKSDAYGYIVRNSDKIRSVETLDSMHFGEVRVYVKLDLVVRSKKSPYLIVDWKTGKKSEEAKAQLALYALFALKSKPELKITDVQIMNIFLKDGEVLNYPSVTHKDLDEARIRADNEIAEEAAFLIGDTPEERIRNNTPLPMEAFENTEKPACRFCNYRMLCDREEPVDHATP